MALGTPGARSLWGRSWIWGDAGARCCRPLQGAGRRRRRRRPMSFFLIPSPRPRARGSGQGVRRPDATVVAPSCPAQAAACSRPGPARLCTLRALQPQIPYFPPIFQDSPDSSSWTDKLPRDGPSAAVKPFPRSPSHPAPLAANPCVPPVSPASHLLVHEPNRGNLHPKYP